MRSKINRRILKSLSRIGTVGLLLFFALSFGKISGTNSFFSDSSAVSGNTLSAGYWIPELHMTVSPAEPDGEGGFYKTTPCVTLTADINGDNSDITIFYEFSGDGNPISGGTVYSGACVPVPDGNPTHFQAQAYNNENHDWLSNIVSDDFDINPGAEEGEVVINELMWMGSKNDSDDEWIELRNLTDRDIDLSNWRILNGGSGSGHIEIPHGYEIKAEGYFLITKKKWDETETNLSSDLDADEGRTHVSGMNLNNGGEKLTLENKEHNMIDTVWKNGHHWPAGWHGLLLHMSMERNKTPGDGTDDDSWHTCLDLNCNDTEYWDDEEWNFGTPGKKNLSANDPSDENFDPAALEQEILDEEDNSTDAEEVIVEEKLPADEEISAEEDETGAAGDEAVVDDVPAVIEESVAEEPVEEPEPAIVPEVKKEEPPATEEPKAEPHLELVEPKVEEPKSEEDINSAGAEEQV